MEKTDGTVGYTLQLITHRDSAIKSVADLKGKRVAHVSPSSNSGDTAPRVLFAALGVKPGVDYEVVYSGKHDNSIMGVVNKDYDAAPVANNVVDRMQARGMFKKDDLRVVYESRPFPRTAFGVAHDLPAGSAGQDQAGVPEFRLQGLRAGQGIQGLTRLRADQLLRSTGRTSGTSRRRPGRPIPPREWQSSRRSSARWQPQTRLRTGPQWRGKQRHRRRSHCASNGSPRSITTGKRALGGVDLIIDRPQVVAIIGSSGAGKSTLIRCINRLVEPTAGRILLHGHDMVTLDRAGLRAARRRIGMIFQEFNLVERLTVMQNVLAGRLGYVGLLASLRYRFPPDDVRAAFELLDRVGLDGYHNQRADALSGGQRQRVGIARALMQRPDLLLVDEPTASLDPKTSRQIMRLIRELASERDTPALVNIHDVALAKAFSDRIVGLKDGIVMFDGKPEDLERRGAHAHLRRRGLEPASVARRRRIRSRKNARGTGLPPASAHANRRAAKPD